MLSLTFKIRPNIHLNHLLSKIEGFTSIVEYSQNAKKGYDRADRGIEIERAN